MIQDDLYIPENDVTQTLADGREILLAPAGVPIALHLAKQMGFIKDGAAGPSEAKSELPPEGGQLPAGELTELTGDTAPLDEAKTEDGAAGPSESVLSIGSGTRNPKALKKL